MEGGNILKASKDGGGEGKKKKGAIEIRHEGRKKENLVKMRTSAEKEKKRKEGKFESRRMEG